LITVDLSFNKLEAIPVEVGNLELLKLTNEWEVGIGLLKELQYLDASNNILEAYPEQLDRCQKLSVLCLSHNKLKGVPPTLQKHKELQILDLSFNYIEQLPAEVSAALAPHHLTIFMWPPDKCAV
jgi:Leucine-rich repeat (LRR) protein